MSSFTSKPSNFDFLKSLRASKTAKLKPCPLIKPETILRNYQAVGSLHLLCLARMILGDSVGLGKTVQLIVAYAYMLGKDPDLKLLVITTKSAMFQWASEFAKFTTGISVHVLLEKYAVSKDGMTYGSVEELKASGKSYRTLTNFEARKAQYENVKAQVLIAGYFNVQEDYDFLIANRSLRFAVAFDECFEYHTPVVLEDGTTELIGKIVTQKKAVRVLSYNKQTGKVEPRRVVNWFKNPADVWYKIQGRFSNSVVCTPNHSFYTASGEKRAQELSRGEKIYGYTEKVTDVQWQVLLGSLIGDGSIRHTRRMLSGYNSGLKLMQSEKRLQYLMFKGFLLADHLQSISRQKSGWNRRPMWTLSTKPSPIVTQRLRSLQVVDKNGIKVVTPAWLDSLNPIGIAFWHCDNGCYLPTNKTVSLSTHGFSRVDNELIIEHFERTYGIKFVLVEGKRKSLTSLRANQNDSQKFIDLISPYVPTCMRYKVGGAECGWFWKTYEPPALEWEIFEDVVEKCGPFNFHGSTFAKYRYNIEVEGNHNYFAGGMLVSNCQAFKNDRTKTFFGAEKISQAATRVYGMSATLIKNRLEEAFNIYKVVVPGLLGGKTKFYEKYTIRRKRSVFRQGRKRYFREIIGYANLDEFRERIEPYFLIRRTREVAAELPRLISKKLELDLFPEQDALYKQALSGELYRKIVKQRYFEFKEKFDAHPSPSDKDRETLDRLARQYDVSMTSGGLQDSKIAALTFCQLVANGPAWLREEGDSVKEVEFKRLFDEELRDDKSIVFTRFKSGLVRLETILDTLGIKHVRIDGDMDAKKRLDAQNKFQDMSQGIEVMFITTAGSAAINLQAANVMVFYDTPWSYGDLYQAIGRAQRIGSVYEHLVLIHFICRKTIDEHVIQILDSKKNLIKDVMGDIAEGAIEFKDEAIFTGKASESDIDELFHSVFG